LLDRAKVGKKEIRIRANRRSYFKTSGGKI